MRNSLIVIKKQLKDTVKNKTILIQFILFPIMTLVMENAIHMKGMPELFFTKLFSVMYIGMAPLTSVAAILSEEKEKNTLRVLLMANVKPWQYLLGVGIYVWMICMVGAGVMSIGFSGSELWIYLCIMGVGFLISIIAGACIGMYAKGQMAATSLVMPVMMVLAFAPMLAMFNDKIGKVAKFFFTQQIRLILEEMTLANVTREAYCVMIGNVVVLLFLFSIIFRKKGLD